MKNVLLKSGLLITVSLILVSVPSCALQSQKGGKVKLETAEDSLAYAFGIAVASDLKQSFQLEELNSAALAKGAADLFADDLTISEEDAKQIIRDYYTKMMMAAEEKSLGDNKVFLEENKTKEGVIETESGLQYEILVEGTGPIPEPTDEVTTHYRLSLLDGTEVQSSFGGEPATFQVNGVIPGWTEALQLMPVGSKWKLYIPSDLGYGAQGVPNSPIKPNSLLIFEVELLEIK